MAKFASAIEVFRLLDRSNCRRCGEKTCMAFAGAVYLGTKSLADCPKLDPGLLDRLGCSRADEQEAEEDLIAQLSEQVRGLDPVETARRTGGACSDGRIVLKVLGKDFAIDRAGNFSTDIHVNPWVVVPFLTYLLRCPATPLAGGWIGYREIPGGRERYPLFKKRCEEAMQQVADAWPELFDDIVHLFGGARVAEQFDSDISVVLWPLPKVPVMICYWRPAEGMASSLNVFFEETVDSRLDSGAIFNLGAGLARMFEVLALRHGFAVSGH